MRARGGVPARPPRLEFPRGKSGRTACTFLEVAMRTHGAPAGGADAHRAVPVRGVHIVIASNHRCCVTETSIISVSYTHLTLPTICSV